MTLDFRHVDDGTNYGVESINMRKPTGMGARVPLQSRHPNIQTKNGADKNVQGGNLNKHSQNRFNTSQQQTTTKDRFGFGSGNKKGSTGNVNQASGSNHSSKARTTPSVNAVSDEDSVIIEEKRRKLNGDGYTLHRYLRGRLLGKGGFAKVYLCTALDTNKNYAIKIVAKSNLVKARARQKLQAEIKIHRSLKHKHICEYKHFFEDRQNCYILLELCHNYSMNEMIKRRKRFTEPESAMFMRQLLEAMLHLHEKLVIHRDLKLGNLFLDRNMNIKVGDFGLATQLDNEEDKRKTICGTPNYIAPEVINEDRSTRGHSFEVDVWSMGVILFTTLVGKPPYEAKDVKSTYKRILANEYSFPPQLDISNDAKNIIQAMLKSNPSERPSLNDLSRHPFITNSRIPLSLPSSATHTAPEWKENAFGQLVVASELEELELVSGVASVNRTCMPLGSSSRRNPLSQRDLNADRNVPTDRSNKPSSKAGASQVLDTPNAVKSIFSKIVRNSSSGNGSTAARSTTSGFEVFDESEAGAKLPRASSHNDEELATRMSAALSIRSKDKSVSSQKVQQPAELTPQSAVNTQSVGTLKPSVDSDCMILENMIERVSNVLDASGSVTKKGPLSLYDNVALAPLNHGGPEKWVNRYVDYTSKYGLGYLLSDGSSGVYFNDSTKTVLESEGDNFVYVERKRVASDASAASRQTDPVVSIHTLSQYPSELQKKVTLLKHFRNYLIEQQKKSDNDRAIMHSSETDGSDLVYLKKWVRTKHAIFFRLSDQTVQIVFYDHTEVLLTPDERHITYVDKQHNRNTYYLTEELVAHNGEIAKRLKYTKEILQQLLDSQKR